MMPDVGDQVSLARQSTIESIGRDGGDEQGRRDPPQHSPCVSAVEQHRARQTAVRAECARSVMMLAMLPLRDLGRARGANDSTAEATGRALVAVSPASFLATGYSLPV